MDFNFENIKGFLFSSNFYLPHQWQRVEGFMTQIGPDFVGFLSGICSLTMSTTSMPKSGRFLTRIGPDFAELLSEICRLTMSISRTCFLVPISFYHINAKDHLENSMLPLFVWNHGNQIKWWNESRMWGCLNTSLNNAQIPLVQIFHPVNATKRVLQID